MKERPQIILIHGYTGSPADLGSLASALASDAGPGHVTIVTLPGHGREAGPPSFDRGLFVESIKNAVETASSRGGSIVLIGHSTGGTLALSFLFETGFIPALLVLAATPRRADAACLDRWRRFGGQGAALSLGSVSMLASLVNRTGARAFSSPFPVLILHGDKDELVPATRPDGWDETDFPGRARKVTVPGAGHHLFLGKCGPVAHDIVRGAIRDVAAATEDEAGTAAALSGLEPGVERFLFRWPGSFSHMVRCPSVLSARKEEVHLDRTVPWDPVFANIEITTSCNLSCVYCARKRKTSPKDFMMSKELFTYLLALLPHAYRITLVGLGEPTLHPDLTEMVAHAAEKGRRVGLVTNGMCLDRSLSRELLHAGLSAIAFSIDAPDPEASILRQGSNMGIVTENIRGFMEARGPSSDVSTAIFSALSAKNVRRFDDLVDLASHLGMHVLMATDLNFEEHEADSLWKNAGDETKSIVRKAVARAFAAKLPVLSVHGLEAFGLFRHYRDFLLVPPDALFQRSGRRRHCHSPWQTIPITVEGKALLCDCQPGAVAGDLTSRPLSEIWNGERMMALREAMLGSKPPADCVGCPRF